MKGRLAFAAALVGFGLVTSGASALAPAARHHTASATIMFTSEAFFGKVASSATRCEVGRKVELLMGPTGLQEVVASDVTSSNGDWYVTLDAPQAGHYQAKVLRKTYKVHGRRHVCDPARSPGVDDV